MGKYRSVLLAVAQFAITVSLLEGAAALQRAGVEPFAQYGTQLVVVPALVLVVVLALRARERP